MLSNEDISKIADRVEAALRELRDANTENVEALVKITEAHGETIDRLRQEVFDHGRDIAHLRDRIDALEGSL